MNEENITDVLVSTERGFITWSDIQYSIERYKTILPNPDLLYTKSITFQGLIRHIYATVIKPIMPIDSNRLDYDLLDRVFYNIYIPLCGVFGFQPNILLFANITGIEYGGVTKLGQGHTSAGRPTGNPEASALIQKWHQSCEAGLYSAVSDQSSIGSMFLLKSVYGYREEQTIRIETDGAAPTLDTKQISTGLQSDLPMLPESE